MKKLQKLKQKLTSEEARTWGRGMVSVSFALLGMFAAIGTVFYGTLTAYVWRDGVEVVDTLPAEIIKAGGGGSKTLAEITQELGEIASVAGFAFITIIGGLLAWGSFDAWRRIINYNAKLAREKKENEKEA